jgi:hypothetical protein
VFDLSILRVQAPLYRQEPVTVWCPAASSSVAAVLTWAPPSSDPLSGRRLLYKAHFPLGPAYLEHMPPVCLGSFCGGGACPLRLVEAERGWRHTGLRPIDLVGATLLLIKRTLESFRHLHRLGPLVTNIPAGC